AAVAVVVPLLALSPAAHAEKWVAKDKRGDVVASDNAAEGQWSVPKVAIADITRTVVAHRAGKVVVRVKVRDIVRSDYGLVTRLRTPDHTFSAVYSQVSAKAPGGPGSPGGDYYMRRGNRDIDCTGLTHTISKRNVLRLRVPRTCLDDPTWVRAGARVVSSDKPMQHSYSDQAHPRADSKARTIRVGPRLRVG
ncbi:hypothetical protein, partial [Nocardioides sp.]|uniref:hypothetical protein n=1 Tax=Nocardioides sp. TaxID=35761 RepID=UPI002736F149